MFNNPKRALVTGASSGIGAGLAVKMARRGTEVWLCARRKDKLEEQAESIRAAGGKAHTVELDVSDADATFRRLAALDAEVGGIDLVVANAGVGGDYVMQPVGEIPWQSTRTILNTNLLGAVATIDAFLPGMLSRGHGQVVGVSSIAGDITLPRGAAYGASKAGLTFYLESADIELRPKGVPVTIVHPGFVRTAMTAGLSEAQPMLVELDKAIDIIDRGIQRSDRMIRFPFALGAVARSTNALPRALRSHAIRFALSRGRPKTP